MKLQVLTYFVVQICRLISTPAPNYKSESSIIYSLIYLNILNK